MIAIKLFISCHPIFCSFSIEIRLSNDTADYESCRSDKSKQAFYVKVVKNLLADLGITPENVFITIVENHNIDWSFGNGIAQFVD